ncbi:MAG: Hsp70 family protein, partial [Burkholderiales bacterium]|nr:Hsp70 family protein [Burkholderiales bacterium]
MRLLPLEGAELTMPTAVFYFAEGPHDRDGPPRAFGRAALQAYVSGQDGRLMRSMKSLLGSELMQRATDVGGGRQAAYADVLAGYLKRLKRQAEAQLGGPLRRVVLGRPVYFVDDDPERDSQAEAQLRACAQAVGFEEIAFQFEPIAAAFDHEQHLQAEQLVLVADLGGGTCDFSLVRVGPALAAKADRRDDVLAHHGIHIAGTDFDRHIELAGILGEFGFRSTTDSGREMPSGLFFDLATWHLINTCYAPLRVA